MGPILLLSFLCRMSVSAPNLSVINVIDHDHVTIMDIISKTEIEIDSVSKSLDFEHVLNRTPPTPNYPASKKKKRCSSKRKKRSRKKRATKQSEANILETVENLCLDLSLSPSSDSVFQSHEMEEFYLLNESPSNKTVLDSN